MKALKVIGWIALALTSLWGSSYVVGLSPEPPHLAWYAFPAYLTGFVGTFGGLIGAFVEVNGVDWL